MRLRACWRIPFCCLLICAASVPAPSALAVSYAPPARLIAQELTPVQLEIERQRVRLAAVEVEERRDAAQRLGAMARPDAARAALPALQDSAAIVRVTAAHAILALPPDEAANHLLPLLRDRDELVRREAAHALGRTRSRTATTALAATLTGDRESAVRGAAAVALGEIGDERAASALTETLTRTVGASGFFGRLLRRRTPENDFVRRAAARALGQIGSRQATLALISVLTNAQTEDDVRREAARALGLIGDPAAIPALRAALTARDPYLAQIAHEALQRFAATNGGRPL